jgi:hypothetical protein
MPLETVQIEQSKLGTSGGLDEASSAYLSSNGLVIRSVPSKISYSKNICRYFKNGLLIYLEV